MTNLYEKKISHEEIRSIQRHEKNSPRYSLFSNLIFLLKEWRFNPENEKVIINHNTDEFFLVKKIK